MSSVTPAEAFSPGDYIEAEIAVRGWTHADLAELIGCTVQTVGDIISGQRVITPNNASGLAAAFGTSAQVWMNLQAAYDSQNTR